MPNSFNGTEIEDGAQADEAAEAITQGVTDPAQSPGAEQGVADDQPPPAEDFDPLAVTRKALEDSKPKSEADAEGAPGPESKSDEAAPPEGEAAAKASEQDDANLPFGKHPRFREVIQQRNEARQKIADLEPDAAAYREVTTFMDRSGLVAQEVQEGFAIMAALKTDPARAWQMLEPHVTRLRALMGEVLPDDLRARVDDGRVDEETARELARRRAAEESAVEAARQRRDRDERTATERAAEARTNAVNAFIAERQGKDPDFKVKEPLLRGAILEEIEKRRVARQPVVTPEDAVAVTRAAYAAVAEKVAALRGPAGRANGPLRPLPSSMSSSTPAMPAPRTPLDVTRMALAASGS